LAGKKADKDDEPGKVILSDNENPSRLSEKQKELCKRLDEFHKIALSKEGIAPSGLFRGALYAMEPARRRQNPDWMAQAAHSLRDILYPFYRSGANLKREEALKQYGSAGNLDQLSKSIGQYYGFLSDVSHHNLNVAATNPIINGSKKRPVPITEETFAAVASGFEVVLFEALRRQIDAHKEIDGFLERGERNFETLRKLTTINYDARRYFYSNADHSWLSWLWETGFLSIVKEAPPEDLTGDIYRSPELDYLARVSARAPSEVVDIMLTIPIRPERFNPEVVDRFLWICQGLPPEQLARVVSKIRDERWMFLMAKFSRWGFEYERMLKTLTDAKDYSSLLTLAEVVLEVRPKEEHSKKGFGMMDSPFCFSEIGDSKVFEDLAGVDKPYVETALELMVHTLENIVRLGDAADSGIFDINDECLLIDIDFFTIELGDDRQSSYQKSVRELAAATKKLVQRSIGSMCDNPGAAKRLYGTYIRPLPSSQSVWRLKLFATSLCPHVFRDELRAEFFKIFDYEEPWPLIIGAEYEWAIIKGFPVLSDEDQRAFVSGVISHFGDKRREEWQINCGCSLLSSAYASLTQEEIDHAVRVFGKELDSNYHPRTAMGRTEGGFVNPKGPIRLEEISLMAVPAIVEKLKGDWAPEQLRIQDSVQDFLSPVNADGMGNVLKADIISRPKDYLADAQLFFDRDLLDSHYTYAFLGGVYEALRQKRCPVDMNWNRLLELFQEIINSVKERGFQQGSRAKERLDAWLVGWDGVHMTMADVLRELLKESGGAHLMDFSGYRGVLLEIIGYLLSHPDPEPGTEFNKIETIERDPQTGAEIRKGCDPFTAAINSVRGLAFQAFVQFAEKDEQFLPKNAPSRLSSEVKGLYQKCLNAEKTQAIKFLFGHYLAFFYYRDRAWISSIFSQLFPVDPTKNDLYLAAWEGYLAGDLYLELFEELADYYRRAILLSPAKYPARAYFKDLDEGLASHFALALIHFPNFDPSSDLFVLFWKMNNAKRTREFISFIGRSCLSRDNAAKWIEHHKIDVEKLKRFWDWALENCEDLETLMGFSFWVMAEANVFDPVWLAGRIRLTLEKTGGNVEWNYGLFRSLPILAENAPVDTLEVLKLYFLSAKGLGSRRPWLYLDDELLGVFRALYNNPLTKEETYRLIDKLLPVGSGQFWRLKDIINEK